VATDQQFSKLCKVLNIKPNPHYDSNRDRIENREALNSIIQEKLLLYTKKELIKSFTESGIPFSEIHSTKSLFEAPEVKQMDLLEKIETDDGPLRFNKAPFNFSDTPPVKMERAPALGEHTN